MYIFMVLFYLSFVHGDEEDTMKELRGLLTKNLLKDWFNETLPPQDSTNSYCNLCCVSIKALTVGKHCGSHTLCQYTDNEVGSACAGYIPVTFTNYERQAVVDAHNTLRNKVARGTELRGSPGPQLSSSNMRVVEWDEELALIAERWAAQCIYAHDVCRDVARFPVGQSIALGNLTTHSELMFVKNWYDEVDRFDVSEIEHFNIAGGNHVAERYTQLVWADTYRIADGNQHFENEDVMKKADANASSTKPPRNVNNDGDRLHPVYCNFYLFYIVLNLMRVFL